MQNTSSFCLYLDVQEFEGDLKEFIAIENVEYYTLSIHAEIKPVEMRTEMSFEPAEKNPDGTYPIIEYGRPWQYQPDFTQVTRHTGTFVIRFDLDEPQTPKYVYQIIAHCKDGKKYSFKSDELPKEIIDGPLPIVGVSSDISVPRDKLDDITAKIDQSKVTQEIRDKDALDLEYAEKTRKARYKELFGESDSEMD